MQCASFMANNCFKYAMAYSVDAFVSEFAFNWYCNIYFIFTSSHPIVFIYEYDYSMQTNFIHFSFIRNKFEFLRIMPIFFIKNAKKICIIKSI